MVLLTRPCGKLLSQYVATLSSISFIKRNDELSTPNRLLNMLPIPILYNFKLLTSQNEPGLRRRSKKPAATKRPAQKSSLSQKSVPSRVRPDITPAAIAGPWALGLSGLAGATAGSVHPHYMAAR